jgi:hypothetical protein
VVGGDEVVSEVAINVYPKILVHTAKIESCDAMGKPGACLEFFYERSPRYEANHVGLYPVGDWEVWMEFPRGRERAAVDCETSSSFPP